jgi:hypothetical protein
LSVRIDAEPHISRGLDAPILATKRANVSAAVWAIIHAIGIDRYYAILIFVYDDCALIEAKFGRHMNLGVTTECRMTKSRKLNIF